MSRTGPVALPPALGDILAGLRAALAALPPGADRAALQPPLRAALTAGRAVLDDALAAAPRRGLAHARLRCAFIDGLLRLAFDALARGEATSTALARGEATSTALARGEATSSADAASDGSFLVLAVGGYGRRELAPFSDIDVAFVTHEPPSPATRARIEAMLYTLWDLGLKVGHAVRTADETIAAAQADRTIATAHLEARRLWGDRGLYLALARRFAAEVMGDDPRGFIADKLAERDQRHARMGDARYVVEPQVKDGKGGLRDLHTLFWIGKFVHRVRRVDELVTAGLLTREERRAFARAEDFLWAVRCHLHLLAGRAEERLTFDWQPSVAAAMGFAPTRARRGVERFMQAFFRHAKTVGDLTGLFLAHLDDRHATGPGRYLEAGPAEGEPQAPAALSDGFVLDRGRIAEPVPDRLADEPIRLLRLFALADRLERQVHPRTMRAARAAAARLTGPALAGLRRDPTANALLLAILTSPRGPEAPLRAMNEAGVLGRVIPDFGRIVGQMQFDMYHHYTVDEHTLRAIGLAHRVLTGHERDAHPLSSALAPRLDDPALLLVALFFHDIAKGRGGDHSVLGARVATRVGPRLGLAPAQVETVAWLVRHHLLMSHTAFKRDLADPQTIQDFAATVASPERLRLLLILTVCDIRAVGPGTWNGWKRQLLGTLYDAAEERLRLGHQQRGRAARIAAKRAYVEAVVDAAPGPLRAAMHSLPDSYWVGEPVEVIARNIAQLLAMPAEAGVDIAASADPDRGATLVSVIAADRPGLFYRIAAGIHQAGGNVIDARIHTTRDGRAMDNFVVQDPLGRPFAEAAQIARLDAAIRTALADDAPLLPRLKAVPPMRPRAGAFAINPAVAIDNAASGRLTVVEVSAADRPALLAALGNALMNAGTRVHSAHIATYGERAVDTFYVTDAEGAKLTDPAAREALRAALLAALA